MGTFTKSDLVIHAHNPILNIRMDSINREPMSNASIQSMNSASLDEKTSSVTSQAKTHVENKTSSDAPEDNERVVFQPVDQNPYDLSYTCLMIPRFSSHYLMGDLADRLPEWMQQICISFGWRLEFTNIKPEYFQWAISVPPSTSTAYFMKAIRHQTTLFIFAEFPRIRRENVSNDFWAPGYLIYFGIQPHPIEVIRSFIRQTRQQQGILPNG